jgi:hypothetical protein
MKLSRIQQIIKEEVAKALNEGPYSEKVGKAIKLKAEGITQTINNKTKNKEYTFEYTYWIYPKDPNGDPDTEFDKVTVEASSEEKARDLAYEKAKGKHKSRVRASKEKFKLLPN